MSAGRSVWIGPDEVDAPLTVGRVCRTVRPIDRYALRRDDGRAPVPAGALVQVAEIRPYGDALARVLLDDAAAMGETATAALDLQGLGLFDVVIQ